MKAFDVEELINHLQQGISVFDEDLNLVACNHKFINLLDFPERLSKTGTPLRDFFEYNAMRGEYGDGNAEDLINKRIEDAKSGYGHCLERKRPDGTIIRIQGMYTSQNWMISTYTDVTDLRRQEQNLEQQNKELHANNRIKENIIVRTENELKEQNRVLEIVIENTKHGISLFDHDLKLKVCNQRFVELMEFPQELGQPGISMEKMFEFNVHRGEYGTGDVENMVRERVELAKQFLPHKFERTRPDGTVVEIIGTPVEDGFVSTYTDISQLKKTQIELENAQKNLQQKVDEQTQEICLSKKRIEEFSAAASDWFWEVDKDNRVVFISDRYEQITGMPVKDVIGLSRLDVTEDDLSSIQWKKHLKTVAEHKPFRNFRYQLCTPSGKKFWVSVSGMPCFDEDGEFTGYRGTGSDITREVTYANTIQESEQWLAAYFENTPLVVIQWDCKKNIVQWNSQASQLFGHSLLSSDFSYQKLFDETNLIKFDQMFTHLLERSGGERDEFSVLSNDQRNLICSWRNTPLLNDEGHVISVLSMLEDVTEQRQAEDKIRELNRTLEDKVKERTNELTSANKNLADTIDVLKHTQNELVQAEKMSSLASLVGGVAHEVNTPLGVCITAATHHEEQIKKFLSQFETGQIKKSDLSSFLKNSLDSADILRINLQRAAQLVKSFKQVAVDQSSEAKRHIQLDDYLNEVLSSLHPKTKKMNIKISQEVDENISFETYPGAIAQIFTNLIMNSLIHGFQEKTDQYGEISIVADQEKDRINVLYSDSGCGMTAPTAKKIFEPFFTTNRQGGGSGLGMHIVYNLVTQQLSGSIKCISSQGNGTSFIISIPKALRASSD